MDRSRSMLERAGCRAIIVDREAKALLPGLLAGVWRRLVVILPDDDTRSSVAETWPHHTVLCAGDLASFEDWRPGGGQPDNLACLLFASDAGSVPNGVMVAQRNLRTFAAQTIADRHHVGPDDRVSQVFDLTDGLSSFGMSLAWHRAACLCCAAETEPRTLGRYIRGSQLTVWFSTASIGMLARRLGLLRPGAFSSLRLSLFYGEPLTNELATAWGRAAPVSIVESLFFGPAQATIACTAHRWDGRHEQLESVHPESLSEPRRPAPGPLSPAASWARWRVAAKTSC